MEELPPPFASSKNIPEIKYSYTVVKVDGATPKRWLSKGP